MDRCTIVDMTQFNENLVLLPHTDNVWVDPSVVVAVQKFARSADVIERYGIQAWGVAITVNQNIAEGAQNSRISIDVDTQEQADEVIAAVTPKPSA